MASHMEILAVGSVEVSLPPRAHVVADTMGVLEPTKTSSFMCGGTISINATCLLSVFPFLYEVPTKPFEKYIKPDRGIPGRDGNAIRWDHSVEGNPEVNLKIVKVALALMFHVARRPQQNPKTQINKRFNALYATMFPTKQAPTIELDPTLDIKETADWMSQEGLDQQVLNILLFMPEDKLPGKTSKAFVTQLKLFSTFSERTPYVVMKALINDGIGHVMTLRAVADDAAELVTIERELMEKHTKKFPYLKILRLEGHECIVPQAFPNRFKAATIWKRKRDGTFREHRITKELQSDVSDQDLEEALSMPPLKKRGASNVSYER